MSDLERDSFEEFLRDSLENYSSEDTPNWSEMESRLDEVEAASSSGSGGFGVTIAKWVVAVVAIAGLSILVSNLWNNDDTQNGVESNTSKESFINKIRALTIADESEEATEPGEIGTEEMEDGATSRKLTEGDIGLTNSELKNQKSMDNSDADQIVFAKSVPKVQYDPSGFNYSMLRAAVRNTTAPDPIAEFGADVDEGCAPLTVTFKLESQDIAMSYIWDFGDGDMSTDANPVHVYTETGTYSVELTVTSLINQKYITTVSSNPVVVYGTPEVAFNRDTDEDEAGMEVTFVDLSSNVIEWVWNFGDGVRSTSKEENPTHTYTDEGTYIVELVGKDINGCKDTMYSKIRVSGMKLTLNSLIPTAFSPNGDGRNDVFLPLITMTANLDFEMSIYDRQGNLLFETHDINQGWDGRLKGSGRTALQGTYIWVITLKNEQGEDDRQVGTISLFP